MHTYIVKWSIDNGELLEQDREGPFPTIITALVSLQSSIGRDWADNHAADLTASLTDNGLCWVDDVRAVQLSHEAMSPVGPYDQVGGVPKPQVNQFEVKNLALQTAITAVGTRVTQNPADHRMEILSYAKAFGDYLLGVSDGNAKVPMEPRRAAQHSGGMVTQRRGDLKSPLATDGPMRPTVKDLLETDTNWGSPIPHPSRLSPTERSDTYKGRGNTSLEGLMEEDSGEPAMTPEEVDE